MVGFDDLENQGAFFSLSPDGGQSWSDGGGWDFGVTEYPSIDHWAGSRFIGTMAPDYYSSGQVILLDFYDVADQATWVAGLWDFEEYDFFGFENVNFACHDGSLEEWRVGFWTFNGYVGYDIYDLYNAPLVQYPADEESAYISWYEVENCTKSASDLDNDEQMHYAIWQYYNGSADLNNIYIRIDPADYDPDGHNSSAGEIITPENNENMDICARNNNVIIVSESGNDVICYCSADGFDTFDTALVVSSASNPRIAATGDNEAICSFVKDGNLYTSTTKNGGMTWSELSLVSEAPVYDGYRESDLSEIGAVYTGTDDVIYFNRGDARPIINIDSVSGGFGVTVNVENIGSGDGVDVPYSITAAGGLLSMINKSTEGTISINVGDSSAISLPMIIGLGAVTIEINVGSTSKTIYGSQLLVYTKI